MGEGLRLRLAEGEELQMWRVRCQRAGLGISDFQRRGEGGSLLGGTHDMAAERAVMT
jgi:hypothetical protein